MEEKKIRRNEEDMKRKNLNHGIDIKTDENKDANGAKKNYAVN
jgi:hypothetical protein